MEVVKKCPSPMWCLIPVRLVPTSHQLLTLIRLVPTNSFHGFFEVLIYGQKILRSTLSLEDRTLTHNEKQSVAKLLSVVWYSTIFYNEDWISRSLFHHPVSLPCLQYAHCRAWRLPCHIEIDKMQILCNKLSWTTCQLRQFFKFPW